MSGAVTVNWTPLDRLLTFGSPARARRRYSDKVVFATMQRGYEAARRGRGTDGWHTPGTSADAEIGAAGALLRNRMRDLVRNNPLAAQAVQVLVNNIVGTGIRPRSAGKVKSTNKKVDAAWARWQARCDAHGHTDFHGLTALAVREMIEGGDLFALRRFTGPRGRGSLRMQVELREADHLDDAKFETREGGARIRQGIETDAQGRRTAFWMFPDHPGDRDPIFGRRFESMRLPANGVAHLFERQRTQARGVPWGVAAMRSLRDIDDWQHAELVRKKTEACLVGISVQDDMDGVTSTDGAAAGLNAITDAQGNLIEQFSPGMIGYSRGAGDFKFNQPSSAGGVAEWYRVQQHVVAAGFRVPYALMTGDLSQTNFSSSRVGLNEFRRMVELMQWHVVIPMFCARVWDWFIEAAILSGELPEGDYPVEWAPPRFEAVNPLQDAQADVWEVRAGFSTRSQMIAKRGYDPQDVLAEWAADAKAADAEDLIFDTDPRRATRVGVHQGEDAPGKTEPGTDRTPVGDT